MLKLQRGGHIIRQHGDWLTATDSSVRLVEYVMTFTWMTHWACRLPAPVTATSPNFSGPWSFTYCEHSIWSVGPATAARSGAIWPFRSSRRSLEELTSASAYVVKVHDTSTCTLFKWVALLAIYSVYAVRCISEQNGHGVNSQFTIHTWLELWIWRRLILTYEINFTSVAPIYVMHVSYCTCKQYITNYLL